MSPPQETAILLFHYQTYLRNLKLRTLSNDYSNDYLNIWANKPIVL